MSEVPKLIAGLDARKRQLLAAMMRERNVDPLQTPILPLPRDREGYVLSFAQERLWLIDQIEPGNIAYNVPTALRVSGELRPEVLAASFTEVARRHQTLRTTFGMAGGKPVQKVSPSALLPLPLLDLTALPAEAREEETHRLVVDESAQPFDLTQGVLRLRLLRLAAREHAVLFTLHHITSDGWSNGILAQEAVGLYQAFAAGKPSPLPELPIQYVDFAHWQRQTLRGEVLEKMLGFWRGHLAGSSVLELPTDRPRPAVQGAAAGREGSALSLSLSADIKALARSEGATLFMVLASALQTLLSRWSGQEDISLGTPIANRHRTENEKLIGFFVNTLVIRADLSGAPSFRALLRQVRRVAAESFSHQELPFSKLVEELNPQRSLTHTPLFQVMLGLGNAPVTEVSIPGLTFEPLDAGVNAAMFDLNFSVADREGELGFGVDYRAELWDAATVQRLLGHLEVLLAGIVADPDQRISELPLLTAAERQEVIAEWNDTEPPATAPLDERLAWTGRDPAALAAVFDGAELSFGELSAAANRLARRLRRLGVGPGVRVGFCADRSLEMLVGLLAVLRAGGAYVPLDPAYPSERLAWMLADAAAPVLVAHERLLEAFSSYRGERVLLDGALGSASEDPAGPLRPEASPADLLYVIYTSGSTGRPKGVAMTRGVLASLIAWQEREALPGPARTLQFTSLSFDVSAQEILSCWLTGGTLILVSEETRRDPRALLDLLERERVERLYLPFVALRQLAEAAAASSAAGRSHGLALRDVITAGEALQLTRAVVSWFGKLHGCRLHNHYGPTEAHVVTGLILDGDPESWTAAWSSLPPIGRPVSGSRILLVDGSLQPVPAGVPGELCIGGTTLAQGYLGRFDLTAERFVPDGWSGEPGARLYRTGDLARWRTDGWIDLLGRRDGQVKVRGIRVEPGEIEAALAAHPSVLQAAVVALPEAGDGSAAGSLRLVAYYVPESDADSGVGELRDFLHDRLPAAMVPAVFVPLAAFPLTPSGKVDRRSLPAPEGSRSGPAESYVAPRTEAERRLAEIWQSLLGLEQVGVEDNFFELGGHSLLATQVVTRVREAFDVEIPQRALFEAPTVAGLARRIEAAGSRPDDRIAGRAPALGPYPLSFGQERLWLIDQIAPGNVAYNLPIALRLTGPLQLAALEAALTEAVRRHETQRTFFGVEEGRPVQVIASPAPFQIPQIDLSALPVGARDGESRRLAEEEALLSFDLARGPVLRARLLRLAGPDEHALLFTQHHIASDGWSTGVLVREVAALYEAAAEGRPSPLAELAVRYVDYSQWQRDVLQGRAFEESLTYWRRQLGGVPVLELPSDRPRPPIQGFAGAAENWVLPAALTGGLRALGQREGATLFMVLMAAFQALLARHTGQADVAVGAPIAGRDRAELEDLIGFFVNTLVIRTDLSGDPDFRELLGRVRRVSLDAFAHQQVPFERLVEELSPERSLAHSPLFQVSLALQNLPSSALAAPGLAFEPFPASLAVTKFDLTFTMVETEQGLDGVLEYRTDLFEASTVRRMLGHLGNLLEGAVAEPGTALSRLPVLGAAEREQLRAWNATSAALPIDRCLHELFEEQASRTPGAPAVLSEAGELTYRELNDQADRLARRLLRLGVGPEVAVGIHAERSAAMIAGILAVWKAGGAYVPLDPSYPAERLAYLLEDSGAPVMLTQESNRGSLPLPEGVAAVVLDGPEIEEGGGSELPAQWALPDNLACVFYTSGSTGRPKGVSLRHRGYVNRLLWAQEAYRLGADDTVLFKASFGFDFSLWEAFGPLLAGARVAIARPGGQQDPAYLVRAVRDWQVTFIHFVPSMLDVFLREPGLEALASLRQVACGGEALTVELRDRLAARLSVPLDNQYGPTEISIDTTRWACSAHDGARMPIGHPIANTRVHLLDRSFEQVPVLVPGDLYVAGEGLARGYFGRPDLTAERFVPDPYGGPGERLYDTRDRARRGPDGAIEFLGRSDEQVKVRGIRIEPGEIEALLRLHPEVEGAAVVSGRDAGGAVRLLGYFVAQPDSTLQPAELRVHLRIHLPEAMIPALLTRLEALPFHTSGKLDRLALSKMSPVDTDGASAAPRNETEELLAAIWADVLGLERVGVHDDFFELGGHSLVATQLVSRVREAFRIELPQRALFESPTTAGLAERIEAARWYGAEGELMPPVEALGPETDGEALPRLSFAQERLWLIDQLEPGSNAYNIPVALRLTGALDVPALGAALTEVVRRHETLRTTFGTIEAGEEGEREAVPVQLVQPPIPVPVPVVDLSGLEAEKRDREARSLAQIEGGRPFDLSRDRMLRLLLVRSSPEEHALFLTVHHIASDGWSSGVLVRETVALYEAFSQGRPSPLPELPIRYADYSRWQRRVLQGESLQRILGYWRRQLAGVPVLELPTDKPRPALQGPGGATEALAISGELAAALAALGRREGATLFMVLMAAFQALLGRAAGQTDIPVGTPVAGRRRVELEPLIGFFVNTLVIRGDLSGDPTVSELLARVRASSLDAFAYQDVPFEKLVEELNPERSFSHAPLFQVMLVLQNAPGAALEAPGLAFEPLEAGALTAKFDLTLLLVETGNGIAGALEYRPDLFERPTILRLLEHFRLLLEGMAGHPSRRLSELPLLPEQERQALREWNDTSRPEPVWSLEERLAARVALTPEAPALLHHGRSFSFREMDAAAGRLARRLVGLGVGPDVRVGISAERSPEMIAAVLAVVRAGGAYVPVDPAYPAERVALMLEDSAATVLLTQGKLLAALPPFAGRLELLDGLFEPAEEDTEAGLPIPAAKPDDLAYVIYTSGSTGRPKGIAMTRRGLVNLIAWQEQDPLPGPARTLQFSSLSFDVHFQEIFSSWLAGGTLVLLGEEVRRDPHALLALLAAERIERAFVPVVVLRQLAEAAVEEDSPGGLVLRDLIAAGEQLQISPAIANWLARMPGARLHNHYGPSEAHAVTALTLAGDPAGWPVLVPVGRPLTNLRLHLVDTNFQPVAIGAMGELCVAGAGLARGYLDRPDRTAESFVPDPWGEPGDRLYLTGDLARWRADGVIEYLGRRDGQVKVRGVRIEIGEIEAALDRHPGVRQAVVLAVPGHGSDTALRLVAYVVPEASASAFSGPELRDFLRDRLPAAYVPSAFVTVASLTLTPSGKVDRRALANIEPEGEEAPDTYAAPRTQTEELLAGVWSALLGVPRVGVNDDFFDLGGHSLLATQVASRVRRVFGIELPQRALFEAPTVADLALRVEAAQRSGLSEAPPSLEAIEPSDPDDGPARLSFSQERLWLLAQMEPDNAAYNLPVALRSAGRLDPAILEATFAEVVRRHTTLRTTYGVVAGGGSRPVQVAAAAGPVTVPGIDLSGLPEDPRERELQRLTEEEAGRPFDLARGPILRVRLVRLAAEDHALLLNVHHIASDGWSNGVLVREVTEIYSAFSSGRPSPLAELPIQYVDYARWQRRTLRGERLASAIESSRRSLAGTRPLELPADRPRPVVLTSAGAAEPIELAAELAVALKALGRQEGATLFMGVMAAFQALLYRYSGQRDFAVGTPVAGRGRLETEGLIGFFVNTLVLRADLGGDPAPTFTDLLGRVRRTSLEAFAHQDLPFEKLVEELNPERSLSHTPLFQVMCALQNAPAAALELPGLAFRPLGTPTQAAKFDLTLSLTEAVEGLFGTIEYRTDLFEAATVRRMMANLATLLGSALAEPGRPLSELPLLSEAEQRQLMDWNRTERPDLDAGLLHELFALQVAAQPEAPALWAAGEILSYADLGRRSVALALRLADLGVGPEVRVGIFQDRSVEMIVAVLAVLRAGGAYVPLDPAYPADRLDFMAEDSGIRAVLVNERTAERAPGGPQVERVLVDGLGSDDPEAGSFPEVSPDNLAYVIYTSGSTGRPKGVQVPHRGIVNTIRSTIDSQRLGPGERFLQLASLSFDGSVLEIFPALCSGACLCLIGREALPTGEVLAAALREPEVTVALIPPSVLGTLGDAHFPSLKTLNASAEICPAEIVRLWAPGRHFLNLYGPTEGSGYVTAWVAGPGADQTEAPPPIGRLIANARGHVVDPHGNPVPVGVPGELLLGGVCVTRGYLGRPEKTAETFVPDPFGGSLGENGGRLYRTGDLCRWRADGQLEMLGRIDHQVKVRGFRIELGEIESVLHDHPAVRQSAAAARQGPGGPRLIAYVVPELEVAGEYEPLASALRSHLREKLPDFMQPAAFVTLDALPLTASGKLDRAALPEPGDERPELATAYVPPNEGLESAIAEAWQETLGVERVGVEDSFFDLGGHSLLIVELQARLRERLGREIALLDLFRYPTVAALARFLGDEAGAAQEQPLPAVAALRMVSQEVGGIAVIGMAARFPGAPDLETFWQRLRQGDELVTFFSEEELAAAGVPRDLLDNPSYVRAGGMLEGSDLFDADLFDISPREAQIMDPQQRILLECAAEALERAGYGAGSPALAGRGGPDPRVGVYAGGGMSSYGLQNLFGRPVASGLEITLGNDKDYLATRVAYKLNLRGPAFAVQTACSTSLVAIHLACKGLLDNACEMALAGGVTVQFPQKTGYLYEEGSVLSLDGHTRTFDAKAKGTVNSSGVGMVVLKPLAAALADGDTIHAVIKGSAINNDGSEKIGFTAPSETGQALAIAEAQALAGVAAETVGYVETHGTATPIGDPIEVAALTRVFRAGAAAERSCALGSVKTNLGHAGSAAGVAGFLKAVLAVENGEIPPSLNFETPNPALGLAGSPFYVNTALRPWPEDALLPRRAGVSSFGLGGTNAHVVLEKAPERGPSGPSRSWQLLSISARTETALEAATDRLVETLKGLATSSGLADVAYTLHVGRKSWEHRRVLVCQDAQEAVEALASRDPRRILGSALHRGGGSSRPVAFVFSGLGEQYPGIASGLYRDEPVFREHFDRCAALLAPVLGVDLRELLFPADAPTADEGGTDLRRLLGRSPSSEMGPLDRTALLQPALFAIEHSLARLWMDWGIQPQAMVGYSLGEYVAACLAGVLSLEDALRLVVERARLIDALPEGAMLAVSLPETDVLPLLTERPALSLAAVNGPASSVVAGPLEAVAELEAFLAEAGFASRRLRTTHAFHSQMMTPAAQPLAAFVRGLSLRPPRIPYVSNVTGTWITVEQATDPGYWAEHLQRPVRFSEGIGELWRGGRALLEIGPGGSLATLALQHPAASEADDPVALATLRSAYESRSDQAFLLGTLGKLWLAGVKVGWREVYAWERRRRVPLPAYPFERRRYWIEAAAKPAAGASTAVPPSGLYLPAWRRSPLPQALVPGDLAAAGGRWLVFTGKGSGLSARIVERLAAEAVALATVTPEAVFAQPVEGVYTLDPRKTEDYDALLGALLQQWGAPPDRIVHLWTAAPDEEDGERSEEESFVRAQELGFYSLLFLTQSLVRWQMASGGGANGDEPGPLRALVVSAGAARVSGSDKRRFENAPLATVGRSLSLEIPGVVCRLADVTLSGRGEERLAGDLLAEILQERTSSDDPVAYRGGVRWVRTYDSIPARRDGEAEAAVLRPGGALLVVGRAGEALLGAAARLAKLAGGRLALLQDAVAAVGAAPPAGVEVLFTADLADEASLSEALARIEESLGPLEGVIAADVPGSEPPPLPAAYVTREHCEGFLRATFQRLRALRQALEDREPAFCLVASSLASIAVEPNRALQAALDALADAFAGEQAHWTAVSWDRDGIPGSPDTDAAGRVLARLLEHGPVPHAVVSAEDLPSRIRRAADAAAQPIPAVRSGAGALTLHARPNLRNPYVAPGNETEREVTEIWQRLLGIDQIGVHDSFFDLGGDSLLATQVFTRVREAYSVEIQVAEFFEQPTPAAIAAKIEQARSADGESEADKLARILERLDSLSSEEVEAMLAERGLEADRMP